MSVVVIRRMPVGITLVIDAAGAAIAPELVTRSVAVTRPRHAGGAGGRVSDDTRSGALTRATASRVKRSPISSIANRTLAVSGVPGGSPALLAATYVQVRTCPGLTRPRRGSHHSSHSS